VEELASGGEGEANERENREVVEEGAEDAEVGSAGDVSDGVDEACDDEDESEDGSPEGVVDAGQEEGEENDGGELQEVLVNPLVVVKLKPLPVGQLIGISPAPHVGVAAHGHILSDLILMDLPKVLLHEVPIEVLEPSPKSTAKTHQQQLQSQQGARQDDVPVGVGQGKGHRRGQLVHHYHFVIVAV
jgi:hypothetical protein